MIALIQAGGAGTRLKQITGDLPKPMVPICGKPILLWQVENLKSFGFDRIILVVSNKTTAVQDFFGNGSRFGIKIEYIVENEPLGTGGALAYASKMFDEDFALLFGDLMIDIDWKRFYDFFKAKNAAIATFTHPNGHPYDSDVLVINDEEQVVGMLSKKEPRDFYYKNLTNAGLYFVSKDILETFEEPEKIDFEKEVLAPTIAIGGAFAYRSSEYVKDCGTPDRYESVTNDCANGVIASKNLSRKQKCIFLDRDGVINKFGDFVTKADMLEIQDGAPEALKRINESPYLAICVTNQPVIARGDTTFEELENIHNKMETLLGEKGAFINDLFFCPHHPDKGFPGERPEYKIKCDCRKPGIGLFKKAAEKYNIDFAESWMIGDTLQDIQAGINAGCKTILVTSGDPKPDRNKACINAKPDYVCCDLLEAVNKILG